MIFNTRKKYMKFEELKFFKLRQQIRRLCKQIYRLKKAKQFEYEEVINHFMPSIQTEYEKIIEILQYWLKKEKYIEEQRIKKNKAKIILNMSNNKELEIFSCDICNNFESEFPYDPYFERAYNR